MGAAGGFLLGVTRGEHLQDDAAGAADSRCRGAGALRGEGGARPLLDGFEQHRMDLVVMIGRGSGRRPWIAPAPTVVEAEEAPCRETD